MNSIMHASEPLTTKEFFALDVDEKLKVELIGGALAVSPSPKHWHGIVSLMSPGSKVNDRRVKPALYSDAGIPSWRVERSGKQLLLVEIPVQGEERFHLGQITLKVADIDVPIDLDAIARYAFGE